MTRISPVISSLIWSGNRFYGYSHISCQVIIDLRFVINRWFTGVCELKLMMLVSFWFVSSFSCYHLIIHVDRSVLCFSHRLPLMRVWLPCVLVPRWVSVLFCWNKDQHLPSGALSKVYERAFTEPWCQFITSCHLQKVKQHWMWNQAIAKSCHTNVSVCQRLTCACSVSPQYGEEKVSHAALVE